MNNTVERLPKRTYSKTYSKRKHQDTGDDALKRRRVSTLFDESQDSAPSSDLPSSDTLIFSDENHLPSTPPSSPPSFVILPEDKGSRQNQLCDRRDENVSSKALSKPRKPLVQMQLNFGQPMNKTCKDCGMEYVPSAPEDAALHKKFHAQHINGVVLDRDFLRKAESDRTLWRGPHGDFIIVLSGSRDSKSWLKKGRAVLDMATTDLGAVEISDEQLWETRHDTLGGDCSVTAKGSKTVDRYKLYLYVDGGRCVGLCLTEHIEQAYKVLEGDRLTSGLDKEKPATITESGSKLLSIGDEAQEAAIGISRIWTSRGSRKKGVARALLNCVVRTFGESVVQKDKVAFSQPTEMGAALARRWFGKQHGWHVYID